MPDAWIEVTVRYVRPAVVAGDLTTILVGPCERGDLGLLSVLVGPADAALLDQELRGEATARSSALALLGRVASVLSSSATAAYLFFDRRSGAVRGALELSTSRGRLELSVEPGQALTLAAGLHLPLLADRALFTPAATDGEPGRQPLTFYRLDSIGSGGDGSARAENLDLDAHNDGIV